MDPRMMAAAASGDKFDMVKLQHQLKNNSTDIQNYVQDLENWQKDVSKKDKNPAATAKQRANFPLPPIRNKVEIERLQKKQKNDIFEAKDIKENSKKVESNDKLKRDITPMFDYYKSWDKFTKEATEKLDDDEEP